MAAIQQRSAPSSVGPFELSDNDQLRQELDDAFGAIQHFRKIDRKAEETGLYSLGVGCYRRTFLFTEECSFSIDSPEDYVLKVEYEPHPSGNQAEVEAFNEFPRKITENYFVPIVMVAENYRWLIMEYAEVGGAEKSDTRKINEELYDEGLVYGDTAMRNIGYHDGRWKLVDYGHRWEDDDLNEIVSI
jgi:hypothetical protein